MTAVVDLEALHGVAERAYHRHSLLGADDAAAIEAAIAELRELRALKARVEGAPVADRTHPLGEALRASGYYAGASVRLVAESGE